MATEDHTWCPHCETAQETSKWNDGRCPACNELRFKAFVDWDYEDPYEIGE